VPWCAEPGARRELTYVGDAVLGLIAALERGRSGEVYNVAGVGSIEMRSALAEIEALIGRRARLSRHRGGAEAVATAACGDKAREELGYAPAVGLREGLERQLDAATMAPRVAAA
jgi:nucleoside-diphosphate-sugar epimerase